MTPRKFKLIETYPSSLKLGEIVTQRKMATAYQTTSCEVYTYIYESKSCGKAYTPAYIENHPKFWQEIIEKNYEILSFKSSSGIWNKNYNGLFPCSSSGACLHDESYMLNDSHNLYKIHSIKRLSDGEVFTVGDKFHPSKRVDRRRVIKRFCIESYGLTVVTGISTSYDINSISHFKAPIFTTEDGVDIFEGDTYWYIRKLKPWTIGVMEKIRKGGEGPDYKNFSTEEAAKEFIILNKPCLSINDVRKFETSSVYKLIPSLKKLVESKI